MTSQSHTQMQNTRKATSAFSTAPARGMFQSRPFAAPSQTAENSQQPDLKTSLTQAKRYGHHLNQVSVCPPSQSATDSRPIQGVWSYVSEQDRGNIVLGNQVNYGPAADLNPNQRQDIQTHYGQNNRVFGRLDQYNSSHKTYVRAAQETGRILTEQEEIARRTGRNAPNASINHIIASGTGQNILNHETTRFIEGRNRFNQYGNFLPAAQGTQQEADIQAQIRRGIAEQAAAVGRVQGYNRAIINERDGESLLNNPTNRRIYGNSQVEMGRLNALGTRNQALGHTLTGFQGQGQHRHQAYRDVLKMTFDSTGNLRVGSGFGNNQVSTGIDAPLTHNGIPTERANRLMAAHQAYAPDRLLTNNRLFSHDAAGNRLSSSQTYTPINALPYNSRKRKR